jgi:hypothetical protein
LIYRKALPLQEGSVFSGAQSHGSVPRLKQTSKGFVTMTPVLLKNLNVDQARFVAILAKAARTQRDALLGNVAEEDLGGTKPARGEHNQTAELGFAPLAAEAPQIAALRDAISTLSQTARSELYALMRIGQGHLAAKKWYQGLSEAKTLSDDTITAAIIEDSDLHDHLVKGLYEAKLSS